MEVRICRGIKIITGTCSWQEWQKQTRWKDNNHATDNLKKEDLERMRNLILYENISFIFFNGSWCPDSRKEMPGLYKLFETAEISHDKIKIVGLDMDKKDPAGLSEKYTAEHIPTLVVLDENEKEMGRIIEHPAGGWSKALLGILENNPH